MPFQHPSCMQRAISPGSLKQLTGSCKTCSIGGKVNSLGQQHQQNYFLQWECWPRGKESGPPLGRLAGSLAFSPVPPSQPFWSCCPYPCCMPLLCLSLNIAFASLVSWMPSEKTYLKTTPQSSSPPACIHVSSPNACPYPAWMWILGCKSMLFFPLCLYSTWHGGAIPHCQRYISKIKLINNPKTLPRPPSR